MDFAGGKIKGFVGPNDLAVEGAIVDFIAGAKKTLDVGVQELDSKPIAEAIIAAKRAGVHVRVVLNHSYLQDGDGSAPPPNITTVAELAADDSGHKVNRDVFAAFCRCGIEVRIDLNPSAIFHQKFAVRDFRIQADGESKRGGRPALLTGSANFTTTDCRKNLNHVLVFDDRGVAEEFAGEFAEAWGGEFSRGRLGKPPRTIDVDGVPVKVLFAPDHGPEAEVVKQLLKCPKGGEIECAMFTFAGSSAIDDAMVMLVDAGRTIRVVLDRTQSAPSRKWPAARWLDEGGVEVLVPDAQTFPGKLHHKLLVVDTSTVVAGSFNYTEPATLFNDEALLVIGSPHSQTEDVKVNEAECARIATFFRMEIDRIAAGSRKWSAGRFARDGVPVG